MELLTKKGIKILIDDEDFEKANFGKKLFVKNSGFVVIVSHSNNKTKHTFLHKVIMPARKGLQVDHINGNRLDNRKSNLRICTHAENQRNKKKQNGRYKFKYKGVFLRKENLKSGEIVDRWYAFITVNKKRFHKFGAKSEEEAALLYNELAKKYHGEFANLNIIPLTLR